MKAAVVVLNYNLPELTDLLCEDLVRKTKCDYDLYVIENGSSPDNLSKFYTHRSDKNLWVSGGLNYGIRSAMGEGNYDAIWCLFNDATFTPEGDVLSFMLRCMERYPRIGIIQTAWNNEWFLGRRQSAFDEAPELGLVYAASPLCMLFRTEMISDISESLGPDNRPLWDETNKRNHANAELIQLVAYRRGWATVGTTVFTASERYQYADSDSEAARGESNLEWKSAGAVERENWIRRRWRDKSFFLSPNLRRMRDIPRVVRNARTYAHMWYDLSQPDTSGKACWRHSIRLCKREAENFLVRYPEYSNMTGDGQYD